MAKRPGSRRQLLKSAAGAATGAALAALFLPDAVVAQASNAPFPPLSPELARALDDHVARLPNATVSHPGLMAAADKALLEGATSASSPNEIVRRNGTGGFAATQISANQIILGGAARDGLVRIDPPPNTWHQHVLKYRTGVPGTADFNVTIDAADNVHSPRKDVTFAWGYNQSDNSFTGELELPGEPSLSYRIESYYAPRPNVGWMETYIQYVGTSRAAHRPLFVAIDRDSNATSIDMQFDGLSLSDRATRRQLVLVRPGLLALFGGTAIRGMQNDVVFLQQVNSAGTAVNLIRLNGANRVVVGDAGAPTMLADSLLWPVDGMYEIGGASDNRPHSLSLTRRVNIGGRQIIGARMAAIPDSMGSLGENTRAINAILAAIRGSTGHGLIEG